MTDVATVVPVKGLVFKHVTCTEYDYASRSWVPATFIVSHVDHKKGIVHAKPYPHYHGDPLKVRYENFPARVLEVVSVPEPKQGGVNGPKFTEAEFDALYAKAHAAGIAAGEAVTPAVLVVEEHENQFDDSSPVIYREVVSEGACGFAWIKVRPGNGSFAKWAIKKGVGRSSSYEGGVNLWVRQHGQSLERKTAHADAFAAVIREAGVKAYGQSRID